MTKTSLTGVVDHLRVLAAGADADRQLLERFVVRREEAAFAALVRRHGPMVLSVCRRVLHSLPDAEDTFQATFVVLARKAGSIRKREALGSWLHGVAFHLASTARARIARRRWHESRAGWHGRETVPQQELGAETAWRDLQEVLDAELRRLPDVCREPLVLCYLEGLSHEEAARQLGWPVGTVKSRLARARDLLRARLERRGLALSASAFAVALAANTANAVLPAGLVDTTCAASLALGTGGPSQAVATLADEVLRTGTLKVKLAALVLVAGVVAVSVGGWAYQAGQKATNAEQPTSAKRQADKEGPRTDAYGDPLPPDAIARLGTVRLRHGGAVWAVAFSPDGNTLLSGSNDETARLWDVATGKELRRFQDQRFPKQSSWIKSVAFAPDGMNVFTGNYDVCRRWDVGGGNKAPLATLRPPTGYCIAVAANGKTFVTGSGGCIAVWDLKTHQFIREVEDPPKNVEGLAVSRDGKYVSTGGRDNLVRLWDATTGKVLHTLKGHEGEVTSVSFSSDGKTLASGSYDKTIRLWDVATGKGLRQCNGHEAWVEAVSFSPDGKLLASAGRDWYIRLWDPDTAKELRSIKGHLAPIASIAFSPDGKTLASGGLDNLIRLWDVASLKERPVAKGMMGRIGSVAFLPDGKTVVSGSDEGVRVWNAATGKEIRRLTGNAPRYSYYVAVSPHGRFAASGNYEDHKVRIWEIATGKEVGQLHFDESVFIGGMSFSPDSKMLASTNFEGTIQLWDVASGKELRRMADTQKAASVVTFAPDCKMLATASSDASGDHTIRFWETATGKELRRLELHPWSAIDIAFSRDAKVLAAVGGRPGIPNDSSEIRLWDVATGKELPSIRGLAERGMALTFSPDGRTLATPGGDKTIRLWEWATGKERARLVGHESYVLALSFAPNGRQLVSGSADSTGLVWDLTGQHSARRKTGNLSNEELEARWTALAGEDAAKAWQAIWHLALAPESAVLFLRERLRPVPAADKDRIARWIADLDADDFATRRAAAGELERLSDLAEPALRKALEGTPTPELRRQATRLLEKSNAHSSERLRQLRAVETLEYMNTTEARKLLQVIALGAPEARLTREAKGSLERLGRK
jgi:RNA polymerase sigma factor (sigma-70 family)